MNRIDNNVLWYYETSCLTHDASGQLDQMRKRLPQQDMGVMRRSGEKVSASRSKMPLELIGSGETTQTFLVIVQGFMSPTEAFLT